MPEGPSIVILKEEAMQFKGRKVIEVSGNSKIDFSKIQNKKVVDFKSWGKHFLIVFNGFYLRIHMLMWGTYRINEKRDFEPRLSLMFKNGELNFYSCNIKWVAGDVNTNYDWTADVMNEEWDASKAEKNLSNSMKVNVCDALLNQEIFSGVGNIIKNEVLFRIKVHPKSRIDALPPRKLKQLIKEARDYSFDFYHWKKENVLKRHWLIYKKEICPRCKIKSKRGYLGAGKRLTCYCDSCQVLYKK